MFVKQKPKPICKRALFTLLKIKKMINKKTSNKLNRTVFCSILVALLPAFIFAQTNQDSIKLKLDTVQLEKYQAINRNFPLVYPINVQYTYYTPTKMTTKLLGKDYLNADIRNQQTISTSANVLLFRKKGFMILNSFEYQHGTMSFQNIDSALSKPLSSNIQQNIERAEESNVISNAVNFICMGKIFERNFITNLITTVDFSEHGFERAVGKLVVSVNVKQNKRTSISLGLIGNTDPTATVPVTPLIAATYWINSKWLLDAYMPAYVYARRIYSNNSRLSFGFNMLNGAQAFVHPNVSSGSTFDFQRGRMEIASTYQKVLFSGLTLSAKAGYVINMSGKVFETYKSDPIITLSQKPNVSLNIGLSYNFTPKKKSK